jgi:hypothetical protein
VATDDPELRRKLTRACCQRRVARRRVGVEPVVDIDDVIVCARSRARGLGYWNFKDPDPDLKTHLRP